MNEPEKSLIIERTTGKRVFAALTLTWEVGNALTAMLKRHRITADDAQNVMTAFLRVEWTQVEVDLLGAIAVASDLNLYAYDAYVLKCAQSYDLPLMTLDKRLEAAANQLGIPVLSTAP